MRISKITFYARLRLTGEKQIVETKGGIYQEPKNKGDVSLYMYRYKNAKGKRVWMNLGTDFEKARGLFVAAETLHDALVKEGKDPTPAAPTPSDPAPKPTPTSDGTIKSAADKYLADIKLAVELKKKKHKSLLAYGRTLELFHSCCAKTIHKTVLAEIVKDDIFLFEADLRKAKYSGRYVYNNFLNLSIFFKAAGRTFASLGIVKKDWPKKPKRIGGIQVYTDAELDRIVRVAEKHGHRTFFECLICTGFRISEIANSRYEAINFNDSTWTIKSDEEVNYETKTDESERIIPLPLFLTNKLRERMKTEERSRRDLIFPAPRGGVDGHFDRISNDILIEAGVEGRADHHKFRATLITRMLQGRPDEGLKPQDPFKVMRMVGHTKPETILSYYKDLDATNPETQKMVNDMYRRYAPGPKSVPPRQRAAGD